MPDELAEKLAIVSALAQVAGPIADRAIQCIEKLETAKAVARQQEETARAAMEAARLKAEAGQHHRSIIGATILIGGMMSGIFIIAGIAARSGEWAAVEKLVLPVVTFFSGLALGKARS